MSNRKKILLSGIIFLVISVFIVFVVTEINREKKQITDNQKMLNNSQKDLKKDNEFTNQDNFMGVKKYLTYQNNKYGIEFQYPISWTSDMMVTKLKPISPKNCEKGDCQNGVSILTIDNVEKLTLNKYLDKNLNIYKNIKEVKVGNVIGYTVTVVNPVDSSENAAFIVPVSDGNFFKLQGVTLVEEEGDALNQMISSFKFAESKK